jgi:CRP/FNR family transcriptional regulator, cyclic AMP receptor protein
MVDSKVPAADTTKSFHRSFEFEIDRVLASAGGARTYRPGEIVFSQGDPADAVFYVQDGIVKLSAVSVRGKEAVVALLGVGEFFGDSCLADFPVRLRTASAVSSTTVVAVEKTGMFRLLTTNAALASRFIAQVVARSIRTEDDLADQIFYSSEKRLARVLLLLARSGSGDAPQRSVPKPSQEALAEMIGTTRSRVNVFMNKFRRLGYVDYDAARLTVNAPALQDVLRE